GPRHVVQGTEKRRRAPPRRDLMVAAVRFDHQFLRGPDIDRKRQRGNAVEPHPAAVRRHGEFPRDIPAVDLDRVYPVTTLVDVGSLARVPDHAVVAAVAEYPVSASSADERVVTG